MRYRQLLIGVGLIAGLTMVISPSIVMAREINEEHTGGEQSTRPATEEHDTKPETEEQDNTSDSNQRTGVREEAKRLEQTKKMAEKVAAKKTEMKAKCETRKAKIETLMSRVVENRKEHVAKLSSIVEKVEAFYVKSGIVSPNHDTLLADVNEKKAAAEAAADEVKNNASLSCDAEKPREDVQTFKNQRSTALSAVKSYRQSVRALIDDIKQTYVSTQKNEGVQ